MVLVAECDQRRAHQLVRGQVEVLAGALGGQIHRQPLRLLLLAKVDPLQAHDSRRRDRLMGDPVDELEHGTQRFVAPDKRVERKLERVDVERSAQPSGDRDVVDAPAGLQPVQEPQSLLGKRCRQHE